MDTQLNSTKKTVHELYEYRLMKMSEYQKKKEMASLTPKIQLLRNLVRKTHVFQSAKIEKDMTSLLIKRSMVVLKMKKCKKRDIKLTEYEMRNIVERPFAKEKCRKDDYEQAQKCLVEVLFDHLERPFEALQLVEEIRHNRIDLDDSVSCEDNIMNEVYLSSMFYRVDQLPLTRNQGVLDRFFRHRIKKLLMIKDENFVNLELPMFKQSRKTKGYAIFQLRNTIHDDVPNDVVSTLQSKPFVTKRPNMFVMKVRYLRIRYHEKTIEQEKKLVYRDMKERIEYLFDEYETRPFCKISGEIVHVNNFFMKLEFL